MKRLKVRNSQGKLVLLNRREKLIANQLQEKMKFLKNAFGYDIDITTLTQITKRVTEQKFFTIPPADYLPMRAGEGMWADQLTTYRSYSPADTFETGIIQQGSNNARQAKAQTAVDAINVKIFNWAKSLDWTLFELNQAAKSGNWDLVTSLEKSRKMNWDLGIQKVAFLGANNLNGSAVGTCFGLLNQGGTIVNSTLITKKISAMTPDELTTFMTGLLEAYRQNNNRTAWPTHFIIPEDDFNGITRPSSSSFPLKSTLSVLLEAFRETTQNPAFQIKPLAYAMPANSSGILTNPRYTLLNYDEDSIRMDVPLPYTNTLANSLDNFSFQNTGYGQFTGVGVYRPLELLYLDLVS